jgi:uncharacterized protein YpmB
MNKKTAIIIVIVAIAAAIFYFYYWSQQPVEAPTIAGQPAATAEDTAAAIDNDLNNIDVGDLDKDFQEIDKNTESL